MVAADPDPYDPDAGTTAPVYTTLRVLDDTQRLRDALGTLIDQTLHTLLVGTGSGVVPTDEDAIAIGITAEQASDASNWIQITDIMPLAPAGVTLLYEITLES